MDTLHLATARQPHVLTIAGSDSGGGAGIQADIKTASALGCYASSVITALTAQNTLGVQGVHAVPPDFVVQQLKSIFDDDMRPDAVKFGMLAQAETIDALVSFLSSLPEPERPYMVLDPVMISTSGHKLLSEDAHAALLRLLPLVDLLTPNIPEAVALSGAPSPSTLEDMLTLAQTVRANTGAKAVLLKGGHMALPRSAVVAVSQQRNVHWDANEDGSDPAVITDIRAQLGLPASQQVIVDVLLSDTETLFVGPYVESQSTHGTGCTVSAALTSMYAVARVGQTLAKDKELDAAGVKRAIRYTQGAIASAHPLGRGHGPLNHLHLSAPRALPPPTTANPTPFTSYLISSNADIWQEYVRHPFVVQLGNGTLPLESFKHYIAQDYHYLKHYARAHALGAFNAQDFATIEAFSSIQLHIAKESSMHVAYCKEFGLSLGDLEAMPESAACAAYARYILDVAAAGDVLDTYVAVASCLIGYGEVGLWLASRVPSGEAVLEGNPYARWMEDYAGDDFMGAVRRGIVNLEQRVARDPPSPAKLERLRYIWRECVRLERDFWQMGLDISW